MSGETGAKAFAMDHPRLTTMLFGALVLLSQTGAVSAGSAYPGP